MMINGYLQIEYFDYLFAEKRKGDFYVLLQGKGESLKRAEDVC